jgi:hypothetical protein
MKSACYSFRILMILGFSRLIFEEVWNIKCHETTSSGRRVVPCRRTDGRTDRQTDVRKLIVASRILRLRLEISMPTVFMG